MDNPSLATFIRMPIGDSRRLRRFPLSVSGRETLPA